MMQMQVPRMGQYWAHEKKHKLRGKVHMITSTHEGINYFILTEDKESIKFHESELSSWNKENNDE